MKLGFIGAGNMAGAIVRGIIHNEFITPDQVMVSDISKTQCDLFQKETHVLVAKDNVDLVTWADIIMLAVKPIFLQGVLDEIKPYLDGKAIISIVTGWSHARITEALNGTENLQLICVMPNTPALVSQGMTALVEGHTLNEDMFAFTRDMFSAVGRTTVLPQRLLEGYIAICGSGPAYVYMFIEAMADAGVKEGLPRALAYEAAAQAVKGAAQMVLESGSHPAALKDAVCSPGGTTIEAVVALEKGGMRAAVMSAVSANADKARAMSEQRGSNG